jgi:hypothetical protein
MGLDGVEFVIAVEEAFGLAIPDTEAQRLTTPGHLVRYLEGRVLARGNCLEQRAFYSLRRAGMDVLSRPRSELVPAASWTSLLPARGRWRAWRRLHQATGIRPWPAMYLWSPHPIGQPTMGDTARYLVAHAAPFLVGADASWSKDRIEAQVRRLLSERLGIEKFSWDDRFVEELRVD